MSFLCISSVAIVYKSLMGLIFLHLLPHQLPHLHFCVLQSHLKEESTAVPKMLMMPSFSCQSQLLKEETKKRREPENDETRNPEYHYAIKVAKTLSRLTSRNQSLAKMKIQQMLFELEFPADTMQSS